jgi:rare lipoprotein A
MRLRINHAVLVTTLIALAGCGHVPGTGSKRERIAPLPKSGPAADYPVVVGDPFMIEGRTWTPVDSMNYDQVGLAAVGGEEATSGTTISAAHKTLPLPSYIELTSLESGKTIVVRVERRGPMRNDRLIELSPAAAAQLGVGSDSAPVRVRRVNPPEQERAQLRSGGQAPARIDTPKPLLAVLMRKLTGEAAPIAAMPPTDPAPEPLAKPEPVAAPPPRAARSKPAPKPVPRPAPTAAASGGFVVQVGAFSTRDRALAVATPLGGAVSSAGKLWRVRTGPYSSQAQADGALARARAAGYPDARVQRAD